MSTKEIAGKQVDVDAEGYLEDAEQWTEEIAKEIAKEEGLDELNEQHWKVINFMRKEYAENGTGPSIRKLTKQSGVPTKDLYQLFPKGPAKRAARIAGIPKPKGCI